MNIRKFLAITFISGCLSCGVKGSDGSKSKNEEESAVGCEEKRKDYLKKNGFSEGDSLDSFVELLDTKNRSVWQNLPSCQGEIHHQ